MNIRWLELTSERMPEAIRKAEGVCLLPMGCLERHGPHLPLGTDQIVIDEVARRAAEEEPAVVFPSYYFGQIAEARHYPGAFSLPRKPPGRCGRRVTGDRGGALMELQDHHCPGCGGNADRCIDRGHGQSDGHVLSDRRRIDGPVAFKWLMR